MTANDGGFYVEWNDDLEVVLLKPHLESRQW